MSRLESLKIKAKLLQKAKARAGKVIALKEAFAILAQAAGFKSWRDMKEALVLHERIRPPQASALWHIWFATHEEAHAHLEAHGGYLLPYQKHFFICNDDYMRNLGIDLADPDLQKVGADWSRPKDKAAFDRLLRKLPG